MIYIQATKTDEDAMLKIKPLKPALREKKRYVVYKVEAAQALDMHTAQEDIITQLQAYLGVFQSASAGIMPIKYNKQKQQGILRVNHTAVDLVKSCFVMITKINNKQASVRTLGVSGILKKAKENYFD